MSETATVRVKEVKVVKEGTNTKGKWTMYGLVDGNEDLFSWFNNRTLYDEAKDFENKKAEIEYEATDKGRNLKTIKLAEADKAETPALGTGEYVTGQKPVLEARRIAASTAAHVGAQLTRAHLDHLTGREITPQLVRDIYIQMEAHVFGTIVRRGHAIIEDEDVEF